MIHVRRSLPYEDAGLMCPDPDGRGTRGMARLLELLTSLGTLDERRRRRPLGGDWQLSCLVWKLSAAVGGGG